MTALKASGSRLWIGTANGVILSIPFSSPLVNEESGKERRRSSLHQAAAAASSTTSTPVIVTTSDDASERLAVSTFVPTCNTSAAQLSFHGHRDAVKFFIW